MVRRGCCCESMGVVVSWVVVGSGLEEMGGAGVDVTVMSFFFLGLFFFFLGFAWDWSSGWAVVVPCWGGISERS